MVTASNGTGIRVDHYGTDLTINAVDVSGGSYGITAYHYGTGAFSITTTGTVTGGGDIGIYAVNNNGTDLTIDAANVHGNFDGVDARQSGTGALTITATGTVTSTYDAGIRAITAASATDLTINAVDVSAYSHGIYGLHAGTGVLAITTSGTVTGSSGDGIRAPVAAAAV